MENYNFCERESKGKLVPRTGHEGREQMYSSALSLTSALDGGGWTMPHPGRSTPEKDTVPIVQEAGLVLGAVWTGAENLTEGQIVFFKNVKVIKLVIKVENS